MEPFDPPPFDELVATRRTLHVVAEHVLSGELHRHTGRIGLRPTAGGFGTPTFEVDGERRRLEIRAAGLVVQRGDHTAVHRGRTLGELAGRAGLPIGGPEGLYELVTDPDPDQPIHWSPAVVDHLARFLAATADGLARFSDRRRERSPSVAQLWPEHFDLAISMDEVNYGGCLGDDGRPLPYLYVGPWTVPDGAEWNEPWGHGRDWRGEGGEEIAAYFEDGRSWVTAAGEGSTPSGS